MFFVVVLSYQIINLFDPVVEVGDHMYYLRSPLKILDDWPKRAGCHKIPSMNFLWAHWAKVHKKAYPLVTTPGPDLRKLGFIS